MTGRTDSYGRSDFAARHGLSTDGRREAAEAALKQAADAGVEVVRIAFPDQHGLLRGKTIMADGLAGALGSGVTMTSSLLLKDTAHRTVFPVWQDDVGFGKGRLTGAGDILMLPDPASFRVVPWAPHSAWMLADIYEADGTPVPVSPRGVLRDALARLEDRGWDIVTGLEVEFHVLRVTDPRLAAEDGGQPATPPDYAMTSHGYQYLTDDRYDQLEHIYDPIRRAAVALGLPIRSLEVEYGPSQFEVTFHPDGAMAHADNMVLFRAAAKQVCRRAGLLASFMCRPRFRDAMSSGWHLHQSLVDRATGANLFTPADGEALSPLGRQWLAGVLDHAVESCLFSTPTINGYKRYRPNSMAPDRIQWGRDNKGAMLRVLAAPGDPASRIENRVGEPAANPYLYMASQILSGLDGVARGLEATPPVDRPYDAAAPRLPTSLPAALGALRESAFYRQALGDGFVDWFCTIKQAEWDRYVAAVSEWEEREYLALF